MRPRFSVVIPTRERARTLRHALETCFDQEFDDYEIVVCDNYSSPATREVVESQASPRLRYIRTPKPLAMSDNWELAVSQAQGEFVIVLGDDDGLMPYALRELHRLIGCLDARVIRWSAAFYTWPDVALSGEGNYLRLPLRRELRMLEAAAVIASVIRFEAPYIELPMLYNSAVHRSVISELRRRAGRVFGNTYPDVYSGFAIAHVIGRYPSIEVPMTVAGSSGDSYGIATLFRRGASPLDQDFRDLNEEARLPMHRAIPNLPSFPAVPVADSFLLAKEALFPTDETIVLDRKIFTAHCVGGLRAQDAAEWRRSLEALGAILDDDRSLRLWFDETFLRMKPSLGPVRLRTAPLGYDGSFLHLDTSLFGVADVCGAVMLCERILNYRASGIPLPEDSLRRARAASSSTDLMQIKVQPRAWRTEVAVRPVLAALRRLAEAGRVGVTHGWQRLLRLRSGRERP